MIRPYERTLNAMGVHERRAWAVGELGRGEGLDAPPLHSVLDGIRERRATGLRPERIVVLAGQRYREFLMPTLKRMAREAPASRWRDFVDGEPDEGFLDVLARAVGRP